MNQNIDLILKDIEDQYVRENFKRLTNSYNAQDLITGKFKFFEIELIGANTIKAIPHGLSFIPNDIIFVNCEGDFNFYFRYQEFDRTNLYIFISGPVKVRFFAGSFKTDSYGRRVSDFALVAPNAASGVGTKWFTGIGAPPGSIGDVGDFYLDTASKDVYLQTAPLTWTLVGTISATIDATNVDIDDDAANNSIVGDNLQDYLNRYNLPSLSEAPNYNGDGTVNYVEYFSSPTQITANRVYRADFTYDGSLQPLTETWRSYSQSDGTTILKTTAITYTWSSGQLTNKTQVTS